MPFILLIAFLAVGTSDSYKEFSRHSNGMMQYEFISVKCTTGINSSGYAYAPFDKITFKQVNTDGSVTLPACVDGAK